MEAILYKILETVDKAEGQQRLDRAVTIRDIKRNDPEGSISCKRHGFIAQDVLALEGDDNVIIRKDNPERLRYTGEHIIPILVKGMQEQQAIIEELKANQARLEELINKS